jgi:hypothetical protein
MKVELLKIEDLDAYKEYILKHERSSFFSSLAFGDFIRSICPNVIPYYFVAKEQEKIVGILPSFVKKGFLGPVLNSMPWFGSNPGVLADDDTIAIFLLQAFKQTAKWTGCYSSTFIAPPVDNEIYDVFFKPEQEDDVFSDMRIGLITPLPEFKEPEQFSSELLKKVHQKTRNQIIKASKECMVYESYGQEDWDFLKTVHKDNIQAVGGVSKNKEFDIIQKTLRKKIDYKLYVAIADDDSATRIGALFVEYFNKTVEYITPAVVSEYRHLCPMNLLIFSAMGDAAQKGMKWWNWGGTNIPQQEGLYHFKKRFGAEESKYRYYTQIYGAPLLDISKKQILEGYPFFYVLPFSLLGK